MAEDQDQESKTEEPTEYRIADAVNKGNVPIAREATLFGSLAAILGVLLLLAHWSVSRIANTLREALGAAGGIRLEDREAAASFIASLLVDLSAALLPLMAVVAAGGWILVANSAPSWSLFALVAAGMVVMGVVTAASVAMTPWGPRPTPTEA